LRRRPYEAAPAGIRARRSDGLSLSPMNQH
jgi:hypothetical protein